MTKNLVYTTSGIALAAYLAREVSANRSIPPHGN
jgi:hypothetical protein